MLALAHHCAWWLVPVAAVLVVMGAASTGACIGSAIAGPWVAGTDWELYQGFLGMNGAFYAGVATLVGLVVGTMVSTLTRHIV